MIRNPSVTEPYDLYKHCFFASGYLMKISDLKILRVYGQEVERKEFPIPDKITMFRSKRVPVQLNADEDLKDVSLHHVIRSRQCPFADKLMMFDQEFQEYTENNMSAPRDVIDDFNKVILSCLNVV